MKTLFTLILLSLPLILEVVLDTLEYRAGVRDKKRTDFWLRIPYFTLVSIINVWLLPNEYVSWLQFIQSFIMCFGIFFLLFDPIMGLIIKGDIRYLGETSETDAFWKKLPWWQVFLIRIWVMAVACGVYFNMDLII